jgi:hypothetical protein
MFRGLSLLGGPFLLLPTPVLVQDVSAPDAGTFLPPRSGFLTGRK